MPTQKLEKLQDFVITQIQKYNVKLETMNCQWIKFKDSKFM